MKVSSHTSGYRGVIVTIEKHRDHDGRVSLYATIDDQVSLPFATDSFNEVLKECRGEIDRRIDQQKVFANQADNRINQPSQERSSRQTTLFPLIQAIPPANPKSKSTGQLIVRNMKVFSHTSKHRGATIMIEKHKNQDDALSLHAKINGQVFHPTANDSLAAILQECRAQVDWIDQQKGVGKRS